MSDTVAQIKERIDIAEYIGAYTKLVPAGGNFKGLSPFTTEKTPSFFVSSERQTYYCFSSGKGGDIFTFVQEMEGVDFKGALRILAEKANVPLSFESSGERNKRDLVFEIHEKAAQFFEEVYRRSTSAKEYVTSRGISEATRAQFRIGCAPRDWRMLTDWLTKHKYSPKDVVTAGLAKENASRVYDRFRGRVMFPLFDTSGRVVAFSGRILPELAESEQGEVAKYLNSPETDIYHKSSLLYGLNFAKQAMRAQKRAVVVEGQMDLVMSHQAGIAECVALSGTALTDVQIKQILTHTGHIVFALDADGAGERALRRSSEVALTLGAEVSVAALTSGSDPADSIARDGAEAWKGVLTAARSIFDFYTQKAKVGVREQGGEHALLDAATTTIIPLIACLENRVREEAEVRALSRALGIAEDAIRTEVLNARRAHAQAHSRGEERGDAMPESKRPSSEVRSKVLCERLLALLYWQRKKSAPDFDWKSIYEQARKELSLAELDSLDAHPEQERILFETERLYSTGAGLEVAEELYALIKRALLLEERDRITFALRKAEGEGDNTATEKLLEQHREISKKLSV